MEVNYYVNEAKKVVTCKLTKCYDELEKQMQKKGCYLPSWDDSLVIPNEFVGQAVCSSDDEFDENFGKSLAYQRAMIKMNAAIITVAKKEAEITIKANNRYVADLMGVVDKVRNVSNGRRESINNLLHPVSN